MRRHQNTHYCFRERRPSLKQKVKLRSSAFPRQLCYHKLLFYLAEERGHMNYFFTLAEWKSGETAILHELNPPQRKKRIFPGRGGPGRQCFCAWAAARLSKQAPMPKEVFIRIAPSVPLPRGTHSHGKNGNTSRSTPGCRKIGASRPLEDGAPARVSTTGRRHARRRPTP